jgi:hypothetical protein
MSERAHAADGNYIVVDFICGVIFQSGATWQWRGDARLLIAARCIINCKQSV